MRGGGGGGGVGGAAASHGGLGVGEEGSLRVARRKKRRETKGGKEALAKGRAGHSGGACRAAAG